MTTLATLALAVMAALSPVDVVDLPPGTGPLPACQYEDGNVATDGRASGHRSAPASATT